MLLSKSGFALHSNGFLTVMRKWNVGKLSKYDHPLLIHPAQAAFVNVLQLVDTVGDSQLELAGWDGVER